MNFRELSMTDVREVLRRYQAGQSARQVAREGVADRKTADRYLEAARGLRGEAAGGVDGRGGGAGGPTGPRAPAAGALHVWMQLTPHRERIRRRWSSI